MATRFAIILAALIGLAGIVDAGDRDKQILQAIKAGQGFLKDAQKGGAAARPRRGDLRHRRQRIGRQLADRLGSG